MVAGGARRISYCIRRITITMGNKILSMHCMPLRCRLRVCMCYCYHNPQDIFCLVSVISAYI